MLHGVLVLTLLAGGAALKARVTTCFVPGADCTGQIVREIDKAGNEVLVQAYGFTSCPILNALIRARQRGVAVAVLLDRSNEQPRYAGAIAALEAHGIAPKIDVPAGALDGHSRPRGIAHIKAVIIDRRLVVTGSMNFTWCGQHCNVENALFVDNPEVARAHVQHWQAREAVSRPPRIAPGTAPACANPP